MPRGEGRFWGFFFSIGLNDVFECILKTEVFLTHARKVDSVSVWTIYHNGIVIFSSSLRCSLLQDRSC